MAEGTSTAERAPAVVAVVVAADPGPWLDETLQALAVQDYEPLSVLVLVSGAADEAMGSIAERLPQAFVRRLPEHRSYAAAVNEALGMVEGASFFLLCHDDCAPAPDAVRLLVEESFRSNAGIVTPKMVRFDDPSVVLHVGQGMDRTGAVVERVQDGEIDVGQHDGVRDVFVAPGGCMLVRGDLLRALGGFDPEICAMGEDLDLAWRAHIAGARVVVAPAATARHRELLASGQRPHHSDAPSLQALQRRHELAAVLACTTRLHLVQAISQAALLAIGEVIVAALVGDRRRVRAVAHAWRWNLSRLGALRAKRTAVAAARVVGDGELRRLQVRGSARLSTYLSRLTHQGVAVAHGLTRSLGAPGGHAPPAARSAPAGVERSSASIGTAFSEDADFDDLDDLGRHGRPRGFSTGRILATRRSRVALWLGALAVVLVGARRLIGAPLPLMGQFVPFPAWTSAWHQFVSSWQPAGIGSDAPSSPAFGFLALTGTLLFGRMGLLQEVLVLGCVPVGAWGIARLLAPFGSPRARLAGTLGYLALPLAFDALARGRWDGLVAYAATPWIVLLLARTTGLEPFAGDASPGRSARLRRVAMLGGVSAVAMSLAPAMAIVVVLCGVGISGASLLTGRDLRQAARALAAALGAVALAGVLCLPWVIATVSAGKAALAVFGLPANPASTPGWGTLLRMAVGPIGGSPLSWFLLAAAAAPLLVAHGARLAWAIRMLAVAVPAWLLALVASKAWAFPFAPSVDVVLAPAAVAVAVAVGLGVAAFEADLAGFRFGWRQAVAAVSVAGLLVGALPVVVEAANGRWGVPTSGYATTGLPPAPASAPGYRVLWLGDPRSLPSGGWPIGPGLAYATSVGRLPTSDALWPPASPGGAAALAAAVRVAMRGETVQLGKLLAAARVRDVVVVASLVPRSAGSPAVPSYRAPAGLVAALARQQDLRTVPVSSGGLTVFAVTDRVPVRAPAVGAAPRGGALALLDPLGAAGELAVWAVLLGVLLGRRRWLGWWSPVRKRHGARRRRRRIAAPVVLDDVGAGTGAGAPAGTGAGGSPGSPVLTFPSGEAP